MGKSLYCMGPHGLIIWSIYKGLTPHVGGQCVIINVLLFLFTLTDTACLKPYFF